MGRQPDAELHENPVAEDPVRPGQRVAVLTFVVLGVALFALQVTTADLDSWGVVVLVTTGLVGGLFWAVLFRTTLRPRLARQRQELPVATRGPTGDTRSAVLHAVRRAAVVGPVAFVLMALLSRWGDQENGLIFGIALGGALVGVLQERDLTQWERETGDRIYTRRGARQLAWTARQARDQHVRVPASGRPAS